MNYYYPGLRRFFRIRKEESDCSLRHATIVLLCFAALLCGCSSRVATYPVAGTVKFDDGQPVRIGVVEFRCPQTGLSARAKLDDAGEFSLGTFATADGAPTGEYEIIIVQYFNAPPAGHVHSHSDHNADDHGNPAAHIDDAHDHDTHPDARVALKFSNYKSSPLRATVRADAENKFNFVVTHPKQPLRD
jgi:hypothetical protein